MAEDKQSKEGTGGCEAEAEPHETASLLRCTLSAVMKSLSEKCLLHKYLLCSNSAEYPNFSCPHQRPVRAEHIF
jgi:hypothetical protein